MQWESVFLDDDDDFAMEWSGMWYLKNSLERPFHKNELFWRNLIAFVEAKMTENMKNLRSADERTNKRHEKSSFIVSKAFN